MYYFIGRDKLKRVLAILAVMVIGFSGIQEYGEEIFKSNIEKFLKEKSLNWAVHELSIDTQGAFIIEGEE